MANGFLSLKALGKIALASEFLACAMCSSPPGGHHAKAPEGAAAGRPQPASPPDCPSGMTPIPGGSYTIGETGAATTVDPFCMDVLEVTAEAYQACLRAGKCTEPKAKGSSGRETGCTFGRPGLERHPINCVDWSQAQAFCASVGKRLPSLGEWEWAARNGDRATKYPWGNDAPNAELLNACGTECTAVVKAKRDLDWPAFYPGDDHWPETAPVGSFPKGRNRWGVEDLAGNVHEWTSTSDVDDSRIFAGGSWMCHEEQFGVCATCSFNLAPIYSTEYLGIRCVMSRQAPV